MKKKLVSILLVIWALTACNRSGDADQEVQGSITGKILLRSNDPSIRVFAREVTGDWISWVEPGPGSLTYTLDGLPPGQYAVVGWFHPMGASGAYTTLDLVIAETPVQMLACKDAIVVIDLSPGEAYSGADIGCWGGDFFWLVE